MMDEMPQSSFRAKPRIQPSIYFWCRGGYAGWEIQHILTARFAEGDSVPPNSRSLESDHHQSRGEDRRISGATDAFVHFRSVASVRNYGE